METALLIISILLIVIVLLQSSKAEGAAQIISGSTSELFTHRKERGSELVITRLTWVLGLAFFIICLVSMFIQVIKALYRVFFSYANISSYIDKNKV